MLAFLGLGRMGAPMAGRLVSAGYDVTLWNRTPGRAQVPGATVARSVADAVAPADVVISMLSDPAAVSAVYAEAAPALRPGALVIEMSTVGPAAIDSLRSALPESVELVDAPVMGSVEPAASGKLTVLAGGDVDRCREILSVFGTVRHTGPTGSGAAMKLAVMSMFVPARVAVGESLGYAAAHGLDQAMLLDILAGAGFTRLAEWAGAALASPQPTRYSLAHAAKDLGLVVGGGVPMPIAEAAHVRLRAAESDGLGDHDHSAIVTHAPSHSPHPPPSTAPAHRPQMVNPDSVPPPAGPYSHVARHGDLLYVSGQAALDADGKVIGEGDIVRQSEVVFGYIEAILMDQDATFDDIINIRSFLTSMDHLAGYGQVRRRYVTGRPPTSTTVAVSELFRPGLLLEVELVIAIPLPDHRTGRPGTAHLS